MAQGLFLPVDVGPNFRRKSVIVVPVQGEVPSAMTLSIPATCLAWKHIPDDIIETAILGPAFHITSILYSLDLARDAA